jgi:general secretion pathway protein M
MSSTIAARPPMWRQMSFVAAHLAVIAVVSCAMVLPYQRYVWARQQEIERKRDTLQRFEAVAAQDGAVQEFLRRVEERNSSGVLLPGQNENVASAELQSRLKALAEAQGVVVRSIRALPSKPSYAAQLIGVRLECAGTIEAIRTIVHQIESGPVLLVISETGLRSQIVPRAAMPVVAPTIDAQLDVFGGFIARDKP